MNKKKCAVSELLSGMPDLPFETVSLSECDFTAVSVCLVAPADTGNGQLARIRQQGFGQPVFMVLSGGDAEALPDGISGVIDLAAMTAVRSVTHFCVRHNPVKRVCCRRFSGG